MGICPSKTLGALWKRRPGSPIDGVVVTDTITAPHGHPASLLGKLMAAVESEFRTDVLKLGADELRPCCDVPVELHRFWPGASLRRRRNSPSPPAELTVVSAGGREGRGSRSASARVGSCRLSRHLQQNFPSALLLRLGAAPETSGIYISTYSVCPHLGTTLLTPARMRHVLDFYHQDQEKP